MASKNNNKILIGLGLIGAAAIYATAKKPDAEKEPEKPATPTTPSKPVTPVVTYPAGFPIVYNKYNANAKRLQAAMTGIVADGIIGPNTLARWKQFNPAVTSGFVIANETQLQAAIAQINGKYVALPVFPSTSPSFLGGVKKYFL